MKTVIVTAGGTIEPIDGVRGITNFSRGRLGSMIAGRLSWDHKVYYIRSRTAPPPQSGREENVIDVKVTDTESVWEAIKYIHNNGVQVDVFIHAMAISDYTVDKIVDLDALAHSLSAMSAYGEFRLSAVKDLLNNPPTIDASGKVSSTLQQPILYLKPTQKILPKIKTLWPNTTLVGFKLLNGSTREELLEVATTAMEKVNGDYVVANDLTQINGDEHTAYIIQRGEPSKVICEAYTKMFIVDILEEIVNGGLK